MKKTYHCGIGVVMVSLLCVAFFAHAAVPAVINYQSRLRTREGVAITTATKVSFSLYSESTGTTELWKESYDGGSSVACTKITPDANGYFSVQMGSCVAFPSTLTFTTPLYLGVTIESDDEASPRVAFAPAPYAMNAARVGNFVADTSAGTITGGTLMGEPLGTATAEANGFHSSGLVLQGSGWNGSAAQDKGFKLRTSVTDASNYRLSVLNTTDGSESVSILNNGKVGIGIPNPQSLLEVAGIIYADDFRTRGGSISTTGTGTNDFIRFTRQNLLIGYTSDLNNNLSDIKTLISLTQTGVTFLENTFFDKLISVPNRQIEFGLNTFTFPAELPESNGLVLTSDTEGILSWTSNSGGSVTSVGLSAPADFTVFDSPVTASGTLSFEWKDQKANKVFVGPDSGPNAKPTFRSLVMEDIPDLSAIKITSGIFDIARIPAIPASSVTGTLAVANIPDLSADQITSGIFAAARIPVIASSSIPDLDADKITSGVFGVARGGTGINSNAKGDLLYGDTINSLATLGIGATGQVLSVTAAGLPEWKVPLTKGTVTSVSATIPASLLTLSGSPITDSGILAFDLANQSMNEVFVGPASGPNAKPTFRSLVMEDIPDLSAIKITSGIFDIARIPAIPASSVTGTLAVANIPDLSADQITSGIFAAARIPVIASSSIPDLDADKITSGVFGVARGGTGINSNAKGDLLYGDTINSLATLGIGATGQVLSVTAAGLPVWSAPAVTGVTSVAATVPSILTITGSPITATGTLAIDLATQAKNKIFAGPISGADAKPAFRIIDVADIPALPASQITSGVFASSAIPNLDASKITSGVFGVARGGTGISTYTAKGQILYSDEINSDSLATLGIGANGTVLTVNGEGLPEWKAASAGVTSVGLTLPSLFTISGSPVTASGTLSATLASQGANKFFAGPASGSSIAPDFRVIDPLDIPNLDAGKITSGVFAAARIPAIATSSVPDLDASKIVSGIFNIARIPNIPAANITGTLASSSIPSLDASKIGSGILGTANGGTGLDVVGANGTVLTATGGVPAWKAVPAGLGGSGTFGQLAFWSASSTLAGNPKFIIDNTNNRLAIGTSAAPATTLVVAGDTTVGGDIVPSAGSSYDLGSATKHIRNAYIDDLYIYGGGGSGTSTISATQTVFNGVSYNWPSGGLGNDFVLTTDTSGNLAWKNPTSLVPESGWRGASGVVRLGVITDKVGIGTATPAEKLDVIGNVQASGFLSSAAGQIKFGGATYNFPTTLGSAGQVLTASSTAGNLVWQAPASGIGGSGTVNKIPLFTGAGTVGDSIVSQNTGQVTVGGQFGVSGTASFGAGISVAGTIMPVYGGAVPAPDIGLVSTPWGTVYANKGSLTDLDVARNFKVGNFSMPNGASAAGMVLTTLDNSGNAAWRAPSVGNVGTVTSVRLALPSLFTVSGSPVTASGTLSATLASQGANKFFAGPASGSSIAPDFRVIDPLDIPNLDAGKITSGVFAAARIPAIATSSVPDLDASKIVSGIFNIARIPNIPAANITGTLASSSIPSLDASKIGSGILGTANGGTGLDVVGANGTVLTATGGVPAWKPVSSCGDATTDCNAPRNLNVGNGISFTWRQGANQASIFDKDNGFLQINGKAIMITTSGTTPSVVYLGKSVDDIITGNVSARKLTAEGLTLVTGAGAGKILTSDASGVATWATPVSGLPTIGTPGQVLTVSSGATPVAAWAPPLGETATFKGDKTITGSLTVQGGATGFGKAAGVTLGSIAGDKAYMYRDAARSLVIDTDGTGAPGGTSGTITLSSDSVLIGRPASSNFNFIQLGANTKDVIEVVGALKVGAANTQYTFPYDNGGAAGRVLTTMDAAGTLAWQTPSSTPSFLPDSVAAGEVLASPIGAAGAPDFRVLTASDMPAFDASKITSGTINAARLPALSLTASDIPNLDTDKLTTGTLPVARGGTGLSSIGADGQILSVVSGILSWKTPATGIGGSGTAGTLPVFSATGTISNSFITQTANDVRISGKDFLNDATTTLNKLNASGDVRLRGNVYIGDAAAGTTFIVSAATTTVQSLYIRSTATIGSQLKIPTGAASGKILTSDASGNATWETAPSGIPASVATSTVLASPVGAAGAPAFRGLAASDIPALDAAKIATGTIPVVRGGTGLSTVGTPGQVLTASSSGALAWQTPTNYIDGGNSNTLYIDNSTGTLRKLGSNSNAGTAANVSQLTLSSTANTTAATTINNLTGVVTPVVALPTLTGITKSTSRGNIYSDASGTISFAVSGNSSPKMVLKMTGLEVTGSVKSNGSTLTSDIRLKKNVTALGGVLESISKLKAVYFDWKDEKLAASSGRQIGFIAQDVEKIIPEVVSTDDRGYKGIAYSNLSALALEGIKELNAKVESAASTTGTGILVAGEDSVVIKSVKASASAKIFVTPIGSTGGQVLYIDEIVDGKYFTVKIDKAVRTSVRFNWMVVGE